MYTGFKNDRRFGEDLAMEILQRLPVKPLLRFKCTSKNWYSLINSHMLIGKQLNYHESKNKLKMLIHSHDDIPRVDIISNSEGTPVIENADHLSSFLANTYLMGGHVNGVFLFQKGCGGSDCRMGLWNPATRGVTTLPDAHFLLQPFFWESGGFTGFELDPFTGNYKVIWVREFYDDIDETSFHRAYAAVYSSSKGSWRFIKHKDHRILTTSGYYSCTYPDSTGYLNGAYYWMITWIDDCGLLSFDFDNEVFREISGPDVPYSDRRQYNVILIDGSIHFLIKDDMSIDFGLWFMIQPGVWNKLVTFQYFLTSWPNLHGFWDSNTPIFVSELDGLTSYDINTHEITHLKLRYKEYICTFSISSYKESLVTIK
ncbi:hypothetical protein KY284_002670 [Solanum tuberosum]|nr:hypothetical protein KY284_002670 [Solanum tuberosum]